MSSGREIRRPVTEEDIRAWERGWSEMMVTIWKENIIRLGIFDTGRLHGHISQKVTDTNGQIAIAHEFMLYGIYVARGVGVHYAKGNPGDLPFLDKSYRKAHGLNKPKKVGPAWGGGMTSGKPRAKRDWFSRRYLGSIRVLTEVERDLYGESYMGTLSNIVNAIFGGKIAKGSDGTVITSTLASM